jgi:hypothetical protein
MFKLTLAKMENFRILVPIQRSEIGDAVCCIIYVHEGALHMTAQRMRFFLFVGLAALCMAQRALTNDSIIKLVKAGAGEDLVRTIIRTQVGKYSTGSEDVIALKGAGVSDKIIAAMIEKGSVPMPPSAPSASTSSEPTESLEKGPILPEPEFHGTVYWLDRDNNKLNALEREKTEAVVKVRPLAGGKGMLEVEGTRSPIRFAATGKPEFVFQAEQNVDPQGLAQILTFTIKKGHRELITVQTHGFMGLGGKRIGQEAKDSVSFQASKYNESSITITPTMPLPPGEYGIRLAFSAMEIFCFGVD